MIVIMIIMMMIIINMNHHHLCVTYSFLLILLILILILCLLLHLSCLILRCISTVMLDIAWGVGDAVMIVLMTQSRCGRRECRDDSNHRRHKG